MSPKTVLFVDHAQFVGGAENSLYLLMTHLDMDQWQPHLITANGALANKTQQANIPTHIIDFPRLRRSPSIAQNWYTTAREIAKIAKNVNAKALHANTIRATLYTTLAAKITKIPSIWHMRDFWLSENKPRYVWLDKLGKKMITFGSSVVIANSKATAMHLPTSEKIQQVHNGIDLSKFTPNSSIQNLRSKFQIPQNAYVIGMVGRLRPWKGQVYFLKMASQILESHPNVHFLVVGGANHSVDDPYPLQLKTLAQELGIKDKVVFTGQINNIPNALATMNIFIHPGEPEPFGLVNIEAMAMEKPVVAFNHGALPEIVEDGKTGKLVTPYDIDALATSVTQLIDDPQAQRFMGKNGRKRVEKQFTIQQTVNQITNIYEQIIQI